MTALKFKDVANKINDKSNEEGSSTSRAPGMGTKRMEMILAEETTGVMKKFDLTQAQIDEIQECFKLFDIHGRGVVMGVELQRAAESVGRILSDEDVREIIIEVDANETGQIDFLDFITMLGKNDKEPLQETDIQNVFNVFDQDGDTFVSPEELHRTFLALGVDLTGFEINQIFEKYDHDVDGLLSYEDLKPLIEEVNQEIAPTLFDEDIIEDEEQEEPQGGGGGGGGFG